MGTRSSSNANESGNQQPNPPNRSKLKIFSKRKVEIPQMATEQRVFLHSASNILTHALKDPNMRRKISQSTDPTKTVTAIIKAKDAAESLQDPEEPADEIRLQHAQRLIGDAREEVNNLLTIEEEQKMDDTVVDQWAAQNIGYDVAVVQNLYHHGTFGGSYINGPWEVFMQSGGEAERITKMIQAKCGAAYTSWAILLCHNKPELVDELEPTIGINFSNEFSMTIRHLSTASAEAQQMFLNDFIAHSQDLFTETEPSATQAFGPRCSRFLRTLERYAHKTSIMTARYKRLTIAAPHMKKAITGTDIPHDIASLIQFIKTDPRFKKKKKVTVTAINRKAQYIVDQLDTVLTHHWEAPEKVQQAVFDAFQKGTGGAFDELQIMVDLAEKIEVDIQMGFTDTNQETDPNKEEYRPIIEDIKNWVSKTGGDWQGGVGFAPKETEQGIKLSFSSKPKRIRSGTKAIPRKATIAYDNFDRYFNNDGNEQYLETYTTPSWNMYTVNDMRFAMVEGGSIGFMVGLLTGCCILGLLLFFLCGCILITSYVRKQNQTNVVLESIVCGSEEN